MNLLKHKFTPYLETFKSDILTVVLNHKNMFILYKQDNLFLRQ